MDKYYFQLQHGNMEFIRRMDKVAKQKGLKEYCCSQVQAARARAEII